MLSTEPKVRIKVEQRIFDMMCLTLMILPPDIALLAVPVVPGWMQCYQGLGGGGGGGPGL